MHACAGGTADLHCRYLHLGASRRCEGIGYTPYACHGTRGDPDLLFAGLDDAPDIRQLIAATVAIEQCRLLLEQGINEFHFYTLNRPELTQAICHALGLREYPEHSLCELNAPGE